MKENKKNPLQHQLQANFLRNVIDIQRHLLTFINR